MLAKMRSDGRGLPTQHRVLACLSSALSGAERRRLVTTNITRQIEIAAEETPIRPVYSHKKLGQFLDHVADDRLHALWHLYAVLGLRRGEALGLTWSMVDLDNKTLRVERSLGVVDGKLTWGPPKSKSGVRTVAMDGTTVSLLRGHWARQGEEKLALGEAYGEGDLVFARADGAPLRPEWVSRRFLVLAKDAGLPVIHLHDLRHSAASMMLTAGVPMKVVSTNLGHSAMAITADVYSHVTTELALAAAELTASALAAGRSELA
jgi:integrase